MLKGAILVLKFVIRSAANMLGYHYAFFLVYVVDNKLLLTMFTSLTDLTNDWCQSLVSMIDNVNHNALTSLYVRL